MYVLDSSALIELLENRQKMKKILEIIKNSPLFTTSICVHEVLVGAENEKERFILKKYFSKIQILKHDTKAALIGSRIERILQQTGTMINAADIFIASICQAQNAEIVTLDKDFSKIKSVKSKVIT